jgi:hypothetical protein
MDSVSKVGVSAAGFVAPPVFRVPYPVSEAAFAVGLRCRQHLPEATASTDLDPSAGFSYRLAPCVAA